MPRVVGIDPGTVSLDVCGLADDEVIVDVTLPTAEALAEPSVILSMLERLSPLDLVAGPSGYGLPLIDARNLSDTDVRLAFLAPQGEQGGIGGLRSLTRALARLPVPVMMMPGVVHLASVPRHRKINRVDMGTADKLCVAALAVREQARRDDCRYADVSCFVLELGGAFTAALAIDHGAIVDGIGGTAGPIGVRSAGALDGEVAYLAGAVTKEMLFRGGAASVAGDPAMPAVRLASPDSTAGREAWEAYIEGAAKAIAMLAVSIPHATDVVLSGRLAHVAGVGEQLTDRLSRVVRGASVRVLRGFAHAASQAAQGAALIADGLAGGASAALVDALGIRHASGTVLDHLHVIDAEKARTRLGIR